MADPPPPSTPPTGNLPGSARRPSLPYPPPAVAVIRSASQGSLRGEAVADGVPRVASATVLPGLGARNPSREQLEPLPGSPQVTAAAASAAWEAVPPPPHATFTREPRERQGSQQRLAPLPGVSAAGATALGRPPSSGRGSRPGTGRSGSGEEERPPLSPASLNPKVPYTKEALGLPEKADVKTDAFNRERQGSKPGEGGKPARGTVKWVPHTHANPKHAKFCFICLHGKLEGERDGLDDDLKRQKQDDQDLPSAVDMKELGYLLSSPQGQAASEGRFRRSGADYERNNITALWLREVSNKIYQETIKGMVAEQNTAISLGVDVKLVVDKEDDVDRKALARLFTMSDEEREKVDQDVDAMGTWCTQFEAKLVDVMPPQRPLGILPEVEGPTEKQIELLEYQQLVDFSQLKGNTALDAKFAMTTADQLIGSKASSKGGLGEWFKAEDLPRPLTQPDVAEVDVVPYPLSMKDIPKYEAMRAMKPTRQPVDALKDPFQRPFLYLADFHETVMPVFEGTAGYGDCRSAEAVCAEEEWLCTTRSIFADNNEPDEESGWGFVPARNRVMPVLIDEPYLPPFDIVGSAGGQKLMTRGIWDPELFDKSSTMVPPLKERGQGLYAVAPTEHPDVPIWSKMLSPQHSREQKITDLIPTIPVRSWTRFRPKKVLVELPEFLWNLVRDDAAGQGLWDVVNQRHEIPGAEAAEKERQRLAIQQELDEEAAKVKATEEAEQAAIRQAALAEASAADPLASLAGTPDASRPGTARTTGQAPDRTQAPGTSAAQADVTTRPRLEEPAAGMPKMDVTPPETPRPTEELPPAPSGGAPLHTSPPERAQAHSAASPGVTAAGTPPMATVPPPPISPHSTTQAGQGRERFVNLHVQEHRDRTQALVKQGGEGRKVEELLADDRFLDNLATRITMKLGAPDMMGGTGMTQAPFARRTDMGASALMTGKPTITRPDPPSFAEPADGFSKAQLPKALQVGGGAMGAQSGDTEQRRRADNSTIPATSTDVNAFTQEKMRGDCYVRLLVHPDAAAAKKAIIPYQGDTLNPDISLVMGSNRPNLQVPAKPPFMNEEGEMVDDDEFADFEKHDNVAFSFVRHNRFEAVEALIQQENDILVARDEYGNNLLHIACQNDHRRIAKLLLKNGIQVNDQNNRGNTPLHYCYQYNFMQLSDYLIAHGAEETLANKAGLMPAQGTGVEDPIGAAQKGLTSSGR
eukprot:TRINITY_DN47276_c0_g1_i1.p1 TRINITY_DN47276_c0_g1~~TRINITY_DN47276_c0_g1_i1.p1  ORF type:complete len:1210 (+),score=282.39 TRINITY_DN47276_c0_g1_i1:26-3655(+)